MSTFLHVREKRLSDSRFPELADVVSNAVDGFFFGVALEEVADLVGHADHVSLLHMGLRCSGLSYPLKPQPQRRCNTLLGLEKPVEFEASLN